MKKLNTNIYNYVIFFLIIFLSCCLNSLIKCMTMTQQLNDIYSETLTENSKFKIDNSLSNKTSEYLNQNNSILPFESTNTSLQRRVCYFANWGKILP